MKVDYMCCHDSRMVFIFSDVNILPPYSVCWKTLPMLPCTVWTVSLCKSFLNLSTLLFLELNKDTFTLLISKFHKTKINDNFSVNLVLLYIGNSNITCSLIYFRDTVLTYDLLPLWITEEIFKNLCRKHRYT